MTGGQVPLDKIPAHVLGALGSRADGLRKLPGVAWREYVRRLTDPSVTGPVVAVAAVMSDRLPYEGGLTAEAIATDAHESAATARKALSALTKLGLLTRSRPSRRGGYVYGLTWPTRALPVRVTASRARSECATRARTQCATRARTVEHFPEHSSTTGGASTRAGDRLALARDLHHHLDRDFNEDAFKAMTPQEQYALNEDMLRERGHKREAARREREDTRTPVFHEGGADYAGCDDPTDHAGHGHEDRPSAALGATLGALGPRPRRPGGGP